jgi:hypothetical protein
MGERQKPGGMQVLKEQIAGRAVAVEIHGEAREGQAHPIRSATARPTASAGSRAVDGAGSGERAGRGVRQVVGDVPHVVRLQTRERSGIGRTPAKRRRARRWAGDRWRRLA